MEIKKKVNRYALYFILFAVAFIPRIYRIYQSPMYTDEITWMVRAKETFLALRTFNKDHIINYFKSNNAWWNVKNDTEAIALPLVFATGPFIAYLGKGQGILSRNIIPDYVAGRVPLVFINSIIVIPFYLLAKKMLKEREAFFLSFLFALDPISIANSRLIMNDGLLSLFILLAVYGFFCIRNNFCSILLSSVGLAFGFLTKPVGILPIFAWILYFLISGNKKANAVKIFKIGLLSLFFILLLWPQSWFNPILSIFEYLFRQFNLTKQATQIFFMGEIIYKVPYYYYFIQALMRIPLYILIGSILSAITLIQLLRKHKIWKLCKENSDYLSIFLFAVLFFIVISFSIKKSGIRYLMPMIPFIYLFAGFFYRFLKINTKISFMLNAGLVTSIFICMLTAYKYNPNYDYYVNELFRGFGTAQKYISVSLCYGAKESSEYIRKCYPAINTVAYIGCADTVMPYYYSGNISKTVGQNKILIVEEYYNQMNYISQDIKSSINDKTHVVLERNGIILSRIYDMGAGAELKCSKI